MNELVRKIIKSFTWVAGPVGEGDEPGDSKPQDKFNALSCVLEFIQNALDAIAKSFSNTLIKIHASRVSYMSFKENFLKDKFEDYLENSELSAMQKIPEHGKDINCLIMEDFNTTGLLGDPNHYFSKLPNGQPNLIHQFTHEIGGRRKGKSAHLGGSEGEGKQTFCLSSDISTFFFFTVRDDGTEFFMGISYFGIFELNGTEYKPFVHFGNKVESKDYTGKFWALPISDQTKIEKLKKIFGVKRKKEPGLTVVIPFINEDVTLDKVKETICNNYRVPILRKKLRVEVAEGKEINHETLLEVYKEKYSENETDKKMIEEYFNFIDEIDQQKVKNFDLSIVPQRPTSLDISSNLTDEIQNFYKEGKIIKYQLQFILAKKILKNGKLTDQFEDVNCTFNFYVKKFPDYANQQYKYCDTLRGDMPITQCRKRTTNFFFADIQDEESMLLVKNGEVANHTRVRVDHPKYKVFYKHNVQRPYISFLNNAFMSLQDLLSQSGDTLDEKTTLDLCSIISDKEIENENHGDEDDEDENDDVLTSKYKLPEIPNKLKAYRARVKKENEKIYWVAKGVKYKKEDIARYEEQGELFLKEANKLLNEKKDKLPKKHVQKINQGILSTNNRLTEFEEFKKNDYTFYPIKIRITGAYDDGTSRPYNNYCEEDFDFSDTKTFKYNIHGSLNIVKNDKNKIVCAVSKEDFDFSITGFGKESEEKFMIHHMYERES
mgnify:FL=1|tara:strand:+ start:80 stop:2233 length:2154 start_codon:yes stop_codon:yes gene_type:complete